MEIFFQALVILVTLLISGVVVVFYVYVMPIVLQYESTLFIILHLMCGHWLLLNIAFHYYKAVSTSPGFPPSVSKLRMFSRLKRCEEYHY